MKNLQTNLRVLPDRIGVNRRSTYILWVHISPETRTTWTHNPLLELLRVNCLSPIVVSRRFLYLLPPGVGEREAEKLEQEVPEFQIDELFEVPGVGTVCGGLVTQVVISTLAEAVRIRIRIGIFFWLLGSVAVVPTNYWSGQIQILPGLFCGHC